MLTPDQEFHIAQGRLIAWDMYASSILSMSLHPRALECSKCGAIAQSRSTEEIARMADEMLVERDRRLRSLLTGGR